MSVCVCVWGGGGGGGLDHYPIIALVEIGPVAQATSYSGEGTETMPSSKTPNLTGFGPKD